MRSVLTIICLLPWWGCALAAEATVSVTDKNGAPVAGAVIWIDQPASTDVPPSYPKPAEMAQQNKTFAPYALAVPVGAKVEFPNRDRFRHHVYSFSKGNRFELELYGREEKRYVTFDTPGVVAVGCNIHDDMIGFIRVLETQAVAYTDEAGVATIETGGADAPTLFVWHPNGENGAAWEGALAGERVDVTLSMDPDYPSATAVGK